MNRRDFNTMVAGGSLAAKGASVATAPRQVTAFPLQLAKSVAGIRIPDTALAIAAAEIGWSASPRFLYDHCMRTFAFASLAYAKSGLRYDDELVFIGSVLHDLGLVPEYMSPTERFEVDGANAAEKFMVEHQVAKPRIDIVWDAIALHTGNAAVARRRGPETAAVGLGAAMDVMGIGVPDLPADRLREVLGAHPRDGFAQAMIDCFADLCRRKPRAQALQFTAEIGRDHVHDFACPSFTSLITNAPFLALGARP